MYSQSRHSCLSVPKPICLFISLSVHPSVSSIHLSILPSICPSVHQSFRLVGPFGQSVNPSALLCNHLPLIIKKEIKILQCIRTNIFCFSYDWLFQGYARNRGCQAGSLVAQRSDGQCETGYSKGLSDSPSLMHLHRVFWNFKVKLHYVVLNYRNVLQSYYANLLCYSEWKKGVHIGMYLSRLLKTVINWTNIRNSLLPGSISL